jgi:hypothetical protein
MTFFYVIIKPRGPSSSWSYGSWIYNYLCNQCLSQNPIHGKVYLIQHYVIKFVSVADRLFSPISSANKTEILVKVALNNIILPNPPLNFHFLWCLYLVHFENSTKYRYYAILTKYADIPLLPLLSKVKPNWNCTIIHLFYLGVSY